MGADDPVAAVLLTTVVSHLTIVPALRLMFRRHWYFEAFMGAFCMMTSLLYHLSECVGNHFFLSELQWHRLDNVGAIGSFGALFGYLADVNPHGATDGLHVFLRPLMQYGALAIALITQEKDPWNEAYTFGPILFFALWPLASHLAQGRRPRYRWAVLGKGLGLLFVGIFFFVLGLDDANDPCRIYHGMWHLCTGFALNLLWRVVPVSNRRPALLGGGNF